MNNNIFIVVPDAIWFSYVPRHWRVKKIRELFSERNTKVSDKDYSALSVGKMGVVPQLDSAAKTDNGDNRKLILKGDFAINSRSDRKGSSGISEFDGSASLIITVLKPNHEINGRFSHYLLRSHYFVEEFYRNGHGLVSDLWTTKWDEMRNIYIPVPPREDQDQIVRYLDWKVSQINKLIHGYQKQIKLLEEQKITVINNAVVHGINSNAETSPSKAEWMGSVPVSWRVMRMKNLFTEINVRSKEGKEPHLSMSQKKGLVTDDENINRPFLSESYAGAKICEKDDLVLNRLKAHLGVFALAPIQGIVSPDYTVLRLNQHIVIPKYAEYLLKSNDCRKELRTRVRGIVEGFWRLYTEDLYAIPVCVPSLEEQSAILEYIYNQCGVIDDAIVTTNRQIYLLREYRTRLISDVVTGQIDVRGVQIPDYIPEEDVPENEEDSEEEIEEETENDGD